MARGGNPLRNAGGKGKGSDSSDEEDEDEAAVVLVEVEEGFLGDLSLEDSVLDSVDGEGEGRLGLTWCCVIKMKEPSSSASPLPRARASSSMMFALVGVSRWLADELEEEVGVEELEEDVEGADEDEVEDDDGEV